MNFQEAILPHIDKQNNLLSFSKFPNLETGGDLFGLWFDDYTAVVQLVLGPGEGCHRTVFSFYQDVDYLERVGNHLTTKEGLCHIGEWHSHNRLALTRPSGGDENTVWSNMRRYGIHRFCLFIATIPSRNDININSFMFKIKGRKRWQKEGRFSLLAYQSPFQRKLKNIEGINLLTLGSEKDNYQCKVDPALEEVKDTKKICIFKQTKQAPCNEEPTNNQQQVNDTRQAMERKGTSKGTDGESVASSTSKSKNDSLSKVSQKDDTLSSAKHQDFRRHDKELDHVKHQNEKEVLPHKKVRNEKPCEHEMINVVEQSPEEDEKSICPLTSLFCMNNKR